VTVLLLVPALLAGWLTRGRRLLLARGAGTGSDWVAVVVGLVTLAVAVAIDVKVAPIIQHVSLLSIRIGFIGALPVANVLVVSLAVLVTNLARRGEVTLSRFTFLLAGGTILFLHIVLVELAPNLFRTYVDNTLGFWVRPGNNIPEVFLVGPNDLRWAPCLLAFVAVGPAILAPALLAGRAARGWQLELGRAPVGAVGSNLLTCHKPMPS
jgi:hypothetical protein